MSALMVQLPLALGGHHTAAAQARHTYRGVVNDGGRAVVYTTMATSLARAQRNIRVRFNRDHGFVIERHVEMQVKQLPD